MAKRTVKIPIRASRHNAIGSKKQATRFSIRQYLNAIICSSIILPFIFLWFREEQTHGWNEGIASAFKNVLNEVEDDIALEASTIENAVPAGFKVMASSFGNSLGSVVNSLENVGATAGGLRGCSYRPVDYRENQEQAGRKSSDLIKEIDHSRAPLNKWFLLHNRMPFAGSGTMGALLRQLSNVNGFNFMTIDKPDTMSNDKTISDVLDKTGINGCPDGYDDSLGAGNPKPMMIMKHHFWMNFTEYHLPQPTYINMIRDPVERYVSEYYHCRHGTEGNPMLKGTNCKYMTRDRLDMTIDECIKNRIDECMEPEFEYFMWLCGSEELCRTKNANYQKKMLTSEFTKHRVLRFYYIVGIVEDFEPTLELLEYLLPTFFRGARAVYKTNKEIQLARNSTRTNNRLQISESSRRFLKQGPLKYEMDLYKFIERLFYEKLDKLIPEELDLMHNISPKDVSSSSTETKSDTKSDTNQLSQAVLERGL